jgi:hypothetical protein
VISATKRALGAQDINTLSAAYMALQENANAYAGFLVEAASADSFDTARNARCSADLADLEQATDAFRKTFATVGTSRGTAALPSSSWVPPFASSIGVNSNRYKAVVAQVSPGAKLTLLKQMKAETVWPNFEDIATEPLPRPTRSP